MSPATADSNLLPEEVLAAILHFARESAAAEESYEFRGHDYTIQEIFQRLADEHPILKKYFPSSREGPSPYSPSLNDSISRLQLAGLIARRNPDYQVMILDPSTETFYRNNVEVKLNEDDLDELREAGEEFEEMISEA